VPEIHPAFRAELDRELSSAVESLRSIAAEHDGKDLIEANVDLTNFLLLMVPADKLAAATAALALHLHRGGTR
jgi:hypothetical protein